MANLTLGQLMKALEETGMSPDSDVKVSMDDGAEDTCGIGEVAAGCDGVLLILNVDRDAGYEAFAQEESEL
jgi:hypothetical protein